MDDNNTDQGKISALDYHAKERPGKLEISATKPCLTAQDLSLAYSPGVAFPCIEISHNELDVFKYTNKGNLVAVISNGSAVLGLGNIGPAASKPVMEGKAVLFKRFADIDVFDIEINAKTVDEIVSSVESLEPTFGGINLEDIKAPECFEVESQLQEKLEIPVFHDDQHGTAIIASAGLLNALEITKRKIDEVKVVFSGAGAAAMACAQLFLDMGVKNENLFMCDSTGVIYEGRTDRMNSYKEKFSIKTDARSIADAMKDADVFVGCSVKGVIDQTMVKSMKKEPIIFAMANPDPEILPSEVLEVAPDAIVATGRTDFPNQVNNVLGFPFIFRGALDVRAKKINYEMKIAAVKAIADLAKEEIPEDVKFAYGNIDFKFGKNYIIPKPFDKRVLTAVAPAVAKAAMKSGVAREDIKDFHQYALDLEARLGQSANFMRSIRTTLQNQERKRLVFAEGMNTRILHAVSKLILEDLIDPILLGNPDEIHKQIEFLGISNLNDVRIIDPTSSPLFTYYVRKYFDDRQRKGVTHALATDLMKQNNYFASMMVKFGEADGMITGTTQNYPECIRPIMRVLGTSQKAKAAGIIILVFQQKVIFLADCTVLESPTSEELANIAINSTGLYRKLMRKEPAVAFLSYSSFGSNRSSHSQRISKAVKLTKEQEPELMVDGEMQADVAVNNFIMQKLFNFSDLKRDADILIFPDLSSANISYKLLSQIGGATSIGPILIPMDYPANIVQRTSSIEEIIRMSHLTAVIAESKSIVPLK